MTHMTGNGLVFRMYFEKFYISNRNRKTNLKNEQFMKEDQETNENKWELPIFSIVSEKIY